MKTIAVLLGLVMTFATVSAKNWKVRGFTSLGSAISDLNTGSCKAFLDNPDNTDSDCYTACSNTGTEIVNVLTFSGYDGGSFDASQFLDKG